MIFKALFGFLTNKNKCLQYRYSNKKLLKKKKVRAKVIEVIISRRNPLVAISTGCNIFLIDNGNITSCCTKDSVNVIRRISDDYFAYGDEHGCLNFCTIKDGELELDYKKRKHYSGINDICVLSKNMIVTADFMGDIIVWEKNKSEKFKPSFTYKVKDGGKALCRISDTSFFLGIAGLYCQTSLVFTQGKDGEFVVNQKLKTECSVSICACILASGHLITGGTNKKITVWSLDKKSSLYKREIDIVMEDSVTNLVALDINSFVSSSVMKKPKVTLGWGASLIKQWEIGDNIARATKRLVAKNGRFWLMAKNTNKSFVVADIDSSIILCEKI